MLKHIIAFTKNNNIFIIFFILIFITSCAKFKQKEGYIYESNMEAFITSAKIKYNNKTIIIDYPKYNCAQVEYNKQEFNQKELNNVCAMLDDFLKRNNIRFPKDKCTDTYTIRNGKILLQNKTHPCYSFSKDLNQVLYTKKKDIYLIQFQSKFGLFQGEF